ncbi:MAG TPA: CHAT domain-containing protein [Thermoanaerobaculia bacterium]|nr:CHAT domain-containing protein [Thermoanaerobaculia bacterium]
MGVFSTWTLPYYWLAGRLLEATEGSQPGAAEAAFRAGELLRARVLHETLGAAAEGGAVSAPELASLAQVQDALGADEALLAFLVAPWQDIAGRPAGGAWVLVVTRDSARPYRLPSREKLRSAVRMFNGFFPRRDGSEAQAAEALYRQLLERPLQELPPGVKRLVLVADDALHELPFAALRAPGGAEPVGTRYELSFAPSATLWWRWRNQGASHTARAALILADPVNPQEVAAAAKAAGADHLDLGPLPGARREGKGVLARFDTGSRLRIGAEASEAFFKQEKVLEPFGLVHFAAHAVLDAENPERSRILLAPGAAGEDGWLEARDIARLDLRGKVVVLASCRTASGQIVRGEGVIGLARAFFEAGAHAVVASLWPLRDDEANAFFDHFYRHLSEGESLAAALSAAQADRAGSPAYGWAGLVVVGNGSIAPLPGGSVQPQGRGPAPSILAVLGLGLCALAPLSWWYARRLKGRPS